MAKIKLTIQELNQEIPAFSAHPYSKKIAASN
jgi:hypothetical protein